MFAGDGHLAVVASCDDPLRSGGEASAESEVEEGGRGLGQVWPWVCGILNNERSIEVERTFKFTAASYGFDL
ncbi:hypothetical protein RchiOBHm_Chr4g0397281 [Rosa chinensis]|uniref:Uncharacterized protein n=1 Tax=Rosa chinensis TaxID=74649 RepID=A0A2P6QS03_ROSCH|nr:hypothetical protein RchiOBHm_Chr4g0397281 [Rosa chinensis]